MTVFTSLGTNAKISDTEDHVASSFFQSVTVKIPGQRDAPGSEYDSGVIPEVMGVVFVLREVNGSRWFKAKDNSDIVVGKALNKNDNASFFSCECSLLQ